MAKPGLPLDGPLGRLLLGAGLTLVDVGARGDVRHEFRMLAPFSRLVVCEPEIEEASGLEERIRAASPWADVTVMTEALWSREGDVVLYVTQSPGMSSLRRPDPRVTRRYAIADAFDVRSELEVPAITLDTAARRYDFGEAGLLKLDTQGTELEILQSGDELVRQLLGVYVETLFRPFYEGQAVFGDIDRHLRERGFELFDLRRSHIRAAGHPDDLYSRRQLTWAHCLYLRDPEAVLAHGGAWPARYLAIAIAYEYFDLALWIAEAAAMGAEVVACVRDHARRETERRLRRRPDDAAALVATTARDPRL
ncbi:MAG TPA: FkbM family methyltransferase [Solirubrobacteraceae bacterium]|jgi:FkbM family methyltransferase|nr:FkbM family methyltransferase [Solirubrobacteraceae bacterium]